MNPTPAVEHIWNIAEPHATTLTPCSVGLINETCLGETRLGSFTALHPIFGDSVHTDIHGITTHLAAKGLVTGCSFPPEMEGCLMWERMDGSGGSRHSCRPDV